MNLSFKNQVNFALVITILFFLILGCDAWVSLTGKIKDENGNPINEAKILVEQGKSKVIEEKSQKDGSYKIFENIAPAPFSFSDIKLTVTKDGYQTYEKFLSQEELDRHKIDVILKKN